MKNDIKILQMSPLFTGVNEQDMEEMISCLDGQMKTYGKNERILTEAETLKKVGVILKGCVQVENEDVFGNRNIQEMLEPGELFGAAYACAGIKINAGQHGPPCGIRRSVCLCGHKEQPGQHHFHI